MKQRTLAFAAAATAIVAAGIACAQYPMVDMVAGKVVQKYQSSSCEQL